MSSMCSVALTDALRAFQAQGRGVFEKSLGVDPRCIRWMVLLASGGVADDFILDVGDVHHVVERIAARAQHSGGGCPER